MVYPQKNPIKKKLTHCFRLLIILLTIVMLSFFAVQGAIYLGLEDQSDQTVDYLIIHGAALWNDRPSPTLERRLNKGLDYLKKHPEPKVVVTGGLGAEERYTEADVMKKYLVSRGIDEKRVIVEDKSANTFENLKYTREIVKEMGDDIEEITVMLTTSEFHMLRARMLANRLGFEAYQNPASTPRSVLLQYTVREYFALIKSFLFDR